MAKSDIRISIDVKAEAEQISSYLSRVPQDVAGRGV